MNIENYKKVLEQIETHPEAWDQTHWHCNTVHCFAGHAQILSGHEANTCFVRRDARIWLDINLYESDYLFDADRTIEDFKDVLKNGIFGQDGFNRHGYDRKGFNRDGFGRNGYDREGYDWKGFNLNRYDRYGYHFDGFDLDGFNPEGFDRNGSDRDGFKRNCSGRNGYDQDGYDRDGLDKNNKLRGLI